jgi:Ca-activated chloride channel family protein
MKNSKTFLLIILTVFLLLPSFPVLADSGSLTVERMLTPDTIYLAGSGYTPETSTVTLSVAGYGGSITQTLPIDVVFAIDSSGSMLTNDPTGLRKDSAKSFVDQLDSSRDTAGVISWDTGINFQYGLTDDFATLKSKIDLVDSSGGTNLNVGLDYSIRMLDNTGQDDSVKAIIFLTDGVGSYTPSTYPSSFTARAANKGYIIYSIGLGSSTNPNNLQDMATATGGEYYNSISPDNLQGIFDAILTTIVLNTSPSQVNITETTMNYIIDEADFSVTPDSIVEVDGNTVITWLNVAQYVGNMDNRLAEEETFVVTFTIKSSQAGSNLPVAVDGQALVNYLDIDGNSQSTTIPQGYITVYQPIWVNI